MKTCLHFLGSLVSTLVVLTAQAQTAQVQIAFAESLGPINIGSMALGQRGLSDEPMWEERVAEVRAPHPRVIRLFIQEKVEHYALGSLLLYQFRNRFESPRLSGWGRQTRPN
jgi:hypothetical protein